MKFKLLWIVVILSVLVSGCASSPHVIGYDILNNSLPAPKLGALYLPKLIDARPEQEKKGLKGKLLTFSSKDAHFSKEVALSITEILSQELNNAGFSLVSKDHTADYKISGAVQHFQAVMSPAKITFLPYLGTVSTLWAKDEFIIALSIYIKMSTPGGGVVVDQTFDVSEDLKLSTGLLSLARYSRGFNYKLKLLNEALKDVLGKIRDEVVAQAKK
ncbi:hypothetical protein ACFL1I_06775 [Candidatus Omnitrophota bacterium]